MRQMHAGLSFKDYDIETLNHQDDHAAHGDVGIDDMFVHLIGNHIAIVLDNDICYRLKFFAGKHFTAGVRGIT